MAEMTTEISFEQKISEGLKLSQALTQLGIDLADRLDEKGTEDKSEFRRRIVAKSFLVATAQLSGQIVKTVSVGSLSLGLIGMKSLLEYHVNTNYIFNHPDHLKNLGWVDRLCKDLFMRTEDFSGVKSKLGNVTVKNRMGAIGRSGLYDNNYAGLNDYAHLVLKQGLLNEKKRFEKLSLNVISQALCNLVDVLSAVNRFFVLGWEGKLKSEVIGFRDLYETPSTNRKPITPCNFAGIKNPTASS